MSSEEKKFEDKAQRPWPTKAVLSKYKPSFVDSDGRQYYLASEVDLGEQTRDWVETRMQAHPARALATWCRLPAHGQRGDLPEESDKVRIQTALETKTLLVLEASALKYSKERGTGFVVLQSVLI